MRTSSINLKLISFASETSRHPQSWAVTLVIQDASRMAGARILPQFYRNRALARQEKSAFEKNVSTGLFAGTWPGLIHL
ncbi:MAG: hypothetical protein QNJ69_07735, partial [Gammaproteobacteria bacterium]|nr:hypothetical protein [Gammaproteobacteria bacterium]